MSVWRPGIFDVQVSFSREHFVGICVKQQDKLCYLVNVYLACNIAGKRILWDEIRGLKGGFVVVDWYVDRFGYKDLQLENRVKELNEVERLAAEGGSPNRKGKR